MTPRNSRRWACAVVALVLAATACSDGAATTTAAPTTTVIAIQGPTTIAPLDLDYGDVSELLDAFPLQGIEVETDRKRFEPAVERTFISEARRSVLVSQVGVDLEGLSDGTVMYLGYLYCATLDQGDDPEAGLGNLASSIAALNGSDAPSRDDWWRATIVALAITAAPCAEYFDATVAYVESLG